MFKLLLLGEIFMKINLFEKWMQKLYKLALLTVVLPSGALVLAVLIWEYQHFNMTEPPAQHQPGVE